MSLRQLGQHRMVDGVRADGDQRIGGELRQFLPAHAQFLAEGRDIDADSRRRDRARWRAVRLRSAGCAATSKVRRTARAFRRRCVQSKLRSRPPITRPMRSLRAITASSASHHNSPSRSGKLDRHIDRERRSGFFEDRIGVLQRVAIAVVEGQADEAPGEIALAHAAVHLVEADRYRCRSGAAF